MEGQKTFPDRPACGGKSVVADGSGLAPMRRFGKAALPKLSARDKRCPRFLPFPEKAKQPADRRFPPVAVGAAAVLLPQPEVSVVGRLHFPAGTPVRVFCGGRTRGLEELPPSEQWKELTQYLQTGNDDEAEDNAKQPDESSLLLLLLENLEEGDEHNGAGRESLESGDSGGVGLFVVRRSQETGDAAQGRADGQDYHEDDNLEFGHTFGNQVKSHAEQDDRSMSRNGSEQQPGGARVGFQAEGETLQDRVQGQRGEDHHVTRAALLPRKLLRTRRWCDFPIYSDLRLGRSQTSRPGHRFDAFFDRIRDEQAAADDQLRDGERVLPLEEGKVLADLRDHVEHGGGQEDASGDAQRQGGGHFHPSPTHRVQGVREKDGAKTRD